MNFKMFPGQLFLKYYQLIFQDSFVLSDKEFICGDRFTLADVLLFCSLEFGVQVGQPMNEQNANIMAWYERVGARPSSAA